MAGLNLFTNNAATTLASGVLIGATSLTVAAGTGAEFPTLAGSEYFYCTIANNAGSVEIIKVTARSTDTFTIVRGQDGTSAAAWSAGDKVELRLTRIDLLNFPQLDSTNTFAATNTFTAVQTFTANPLMNGLTASKPVFTDASKNLTSTGTVAVDQGGTGQTSYTDGQLLIGNTTGNTLAKGTLTAGTGISVTNGPGAAITIASTVTSGQLQTQLFTAPGTWTKPASCTQVRVLVIGGGGGGSPANAGGYGGLALAQVPVSAPVTITVGAGGNVSVAGGTSSFGPAVSATGGGAGTAPTGVDGTGTVSVGTAFKTTIMQSSTPFSILSGATQRATPSPTSGIAYSTSTAFMAGGRGQTSIGGTGGAIVVEFIG
tara:strand:- start:157 stop:1275 length:1119 start_codon:yes stop_codon:yes gene_type:complete